MSRDVRAIVLTAKQWGGCQATEFTVLINLDDADGIDQGAEIILNVKEGT